MAEAGIALGSNLGDSCALLAEAVRRLAAPPANVLSCVSEAYRTPPWGMTDQPDFLNACLIVETELEPIQLLELCQDVESELGRTRGLRWGPRTVDIDILWYDDLKLETPRLTLPHPHMLQRGFVLVPLAEILPDHLLEGVSVKDRAEAFKGIDIVSVGPLMAPAELIKLQGAKTASIQQREAEIKAVGSSD
ncbi:MAG: 2-amino-4-hydroxy-6-hydroxymethyldihydropteridine diphosphokinase [Pseudomonadota bacterium]